MTDQEYVVEKLAELEKRIAALEELLAPVLNDLRTKNELKESFDKTLANMREKKK